MFALFDANWHQIMQGNSFSLFHFLHFSLYEWVIVLMVALLVYYFITLKKRYVLQTVLGVPCALLLAVIHFIYLPEEINDTLRGVLASPYYPSTARLIGLFLVIPLLLVVLAAIVLCVVNLFRRRTFSKKQVLWLTIPLWGSLAVHLVLTFLPGGNNPLIGFQHLLLALLLTLTLTGKEQFFFHKKIVSASSEINANLEARSE